MDAVWMVVGGLAGMVGGVLVGLKWGEWLRDKSQGAYWASNVAVMFSGMGLVFAGNMVAWPGVSVAGIGLMGGGITGLKYGLGKTVGAWRTVDRLTKTKDLPEG